MSLSGVWDQILLATATRLSWVPRSPDSELLCPVWLRHGCGSPPTPVAWETATSHPRSVHLAVRTLAVLFSFPVLIILGMEFSFFTVIVHRMSVFFHGVIHQNPTVRSRPWLVATVVEFWSCQCISEWCLWPQCARLCTCFWISFAICYLFDQFWRYTYRTLCSLFVFSAS